MRQTTTLTTLDGEYLTVLVTDEFEKVVLALLEAVEFIKSKFKDEDLVIGAKAAGLVVLDHVTQEVHVWVNKLGQIVLEVTLQNGTIKTYPDEFDSFFEEPYVGPVKINKFTTVTVAVAGDLANYVREWLLLWGLSTFVVNMETWSNQLYPELRQNFPNVVFSSALEGHDAIKFEFH